MYSGAAERRWSGIGRLLLQFITSIRTIQHTSLDVRDDVVSIFPKSLNDTGKPVDRVRAKSFKGSDGATSLEVLEY